ncbi:oxidoreductase [Caulobacter vibrioides]|nr:oxidoreductase [Caulobacter vibrioides]
MIDELRPLAVVTGAASGVGYELARLAAEDGYDLVIVADLSSIVEAKAGLDQYGGRVYALQVDLSTIEGVDELVELVADRPVDALMINADRGLGYGFLDQDWTEARLVIDANVTGAVYLIQHLARDMRERDRGRILITGSIAAFMPGSFQAVYNGSKAFLDSFAWSLRNELKDTSVTVSCLMPGPTDAGVFADADPLDGARRRHSGRTDPAHVALAGYRAMQKGEGDVVAGFKTKLQSALAEAARLTALDDQRLKAILPSSRKN